MTLFTGATADDSVENEASRDRAYRPAAMPAFKQDLVGLLPKLRRFAMTVTRNAADADDLVQQVCERAMTRQHLWSGEGRFDSWIYAMARNLWIDEIRKRKVRLGKGVVDAAEQDEVLIQPGGDQAIYARQLAALALRMPEGLASVFVLVTVEGHSYRETAAILDIPIGTVMSRLSTARIRLAVMIRAADEKFEKQAARRNARANAASGHGLRRGAATDEAIRSARS